MTPSSAFRAVLPAIRNDSPVKPPDISRHGVTNRPAVVTSVADRPTLTNQKQLKSFLGLASYYRRFVRGFYCLAEPLFRLLQKDRDFVWTEQCHEAFSSLQRALWALVLAPADPTLPFILDTDASVVGMGGLLSQEGPEVERVIAFFSWAFNKAERCYCVSRWELLALVLSIRHIKYYLCAPPLHIEDRPCGSQVAHDLQGAEGSGCQVVRGALGLQLHRGASHINADTLSRRPCAADGCRYCDQRGERERTAGRGGGRCHRSAGGGNLSGAADHRPGRVEATAGAGPGPTVGGGTAAASVGGGIKFGALQRAWTEPASASGEERWQMVCKPCRGLADGSTQSHA